ncbi:DUF637 domain-containing protein [Moraxella sp.]|uniref:two-partner secretion domain-containing protein n=1 Tax=Moraxella sp. TaxID=479 RepID=UPI0026DD1047|nr:DUF637 domain-containing protein [Moraxella sp.]MDO4894185.1 DUF637 domain-containing protein [Moraxella sp.]
MLFSKSSLNIAISAILLSISTSGIAQVISDPKADSNKKPVILAGTHTNGQVVPVVQIRTPVNGISHNQYERFNVNDTGVVLNNARGSTQTQLANQIEGNPFLQQGSAHTIINEINSSKATNIAGIIEVAGQTANVIIANPSGIVVSGAGFINTNEATLTTGTVSHLQGNISHQINAGKINIGQTGMSDRHQANYLNLYAKAVELNGKIHANDSINVIAGSNIITNGLSTPVQASSNKSSAATVAIDTGQLGGMYAGNIRLIVTDQGVGVNNAGILNAAQQVYVSSDGYIKNTGNIHADHQILLSSQTDIYQSAQGVMSTKQGNIHLNANNQTLAGNVTGGRDILLTTNNTLNLHQTNLTANNIETKAKTLSVQQSNMTASNVQLVAKDALSVGKSSIRTTGNITAASLAGSAQMTDNQLNADESINLYTHQNQTLTNSNLTAHKNISIESRKDLVWQNTTANADHHLTLYTTGDQNIGGNLSAKGILSSVSLGLHTITGSTNLTAGAILLKTKKLSIKPQGQLFANATKTQLLTKNPQTTTLSGDLSIISEQALHIRPQTHQLSADGDLWLQSQNGNIDLIGHEGTKGIGSGQLAQLTPKGNLTISAQEIVLQGANITGKNIHLNAGTGSVLVDALSNRLDGQALPIHTIDNLEKQLKQAKQALAIFQKSDAYQSYQQLQTQINSLQFQLALHHSQRQALNNPATPSLPENSRSLGDTLLPPPPSSPPSGIRFRSVSATPLADPKTVADYDQLINQTNAKINELKSALSKHLPAKSKEEALQADVSKLTDQLADLKRNPIGTEYQPSTLTAQNNISMNAAQGILIRSSNLTAANNITLQAQGTLTDKYHKNDQNITASILVDGSHNIYEMGKENSSYYRNHALFVPSQITASNVSLSATKTNQAGQPIHLVVQAGNIDAKSNLTIAANHHLLVDHAINYTHRYDESSSKKGGVLNRKTINVQIQDEYSTALPTSLAAHHISLTAQGHQSNADFYATKMSTTGNISVFATGAINLFSVNDVHEHHQDTQVKRRILGVKAGNATTNHYKLQITALPASLTARYINTKSLGDTTLQGSIFSYLSGANIEAGGKVHLLPAISTLNISTTSQANEVFWQRMQDKGQYTQTAVLPSFTGSTPPTFIADGGLVVQIPISEKDAQRKVIKEQILELAKQPEYSYLNSLIQQNNIDWQTLILTQKEWNYQQAGLTPAGAAILTIAMGMATGGIAPINGTLLGSHTLTAMANTALSTLAEQATISLINNQGNIKAAIKQLGNKDNAKQLAFAIASAGISNKIDKGLNIQGIDQTQLSLNDRFIKGIAQSTSKSLLQSAIYGTDLEDNLKTNLGNQLIALSHQQAFAHLVKPIDTDDTINNIAHKLAAGLTGCLSAKAQGSTCQAGALGASMAEIWADWQIDDPATLTESQKQTIINQAKLIAGTAAALAEEDVNMAVQMAEESVRWNGAYYNKIRANAPKANQEEANRLAALINTGRLEMNKENLDYLYQLNTDKNLTILVSADDVGKVLVTDSWESAKNGSGNLRVTARPVNPFKWAIFGTLTLVKRTDGTYGFYDDTYNFEMHHSLKPDEVLRNINTKIGEPICGFLSGCIGFKISFNKTNYNPKNIIKLKD